MLNRESSIRALKRVAERPTGLSNLKEVDFLLIYKPAGNAEAEGDLLQKIGEALQRSWAMVRVSNYGVKELIRSTSGISARAVVLFGGPVGMALRNRSELILAPALSELLVDLEKKRALWDRLQHARGRLSQAG